MLYAVARCKSQSLKINRGDRGISRVAKTRGLSFVRKGYLIAQYCCKVADCSTTLACTVECLVPLSHSNSPRVFVSRDPIQPRDLLWLVPPLLSHFPQQHRQQLLPLCFLTTYRSTPTVVPLHSSRCESSVRESKRPAPPPPPLLFSSERDSRISNATGDSERAEASQPASS